MSSESSTPRMPHPTGTTRAAFIFIYITVALDMLALGIIIPVLPKLIVGFEGGDYGRAAQITGMFGAAWAAMQFFAAPALGVWSDKVGRRPVVLLSNFGLGLDYVLMALAPSLSWLFVGRLISGITSASFPTASAYIADVTPAEQRAAKFGMLASAFGIGFVIGPALGGLLGKVDLHLPFWVAAGLSLANAAYGFFILPESLPQELRQPFAWKRANPLGSFSLLKSQPLLFGLAIAVFLSSLAHESLPSMFVLYTDFRYKWDERMVGIVLAAVGICSSVVAAVLVTPVTRRFGERTTMLIGFLFGAIGFTVYGIAPTGALFMVGIPLMSLWGLAGATSQSAMSVHVSPTEQGQLQGALGSLRGISGMIGPIFFTQSFAFAVGPLSPAPFPGAPYVLAGVLLLGAWAISLVVTRPKAGAAA